MFLFLRKPMYWITRKHFVVRSLSMQLRLDQLTNQHNYHIQSSPWEMSSRIKKKKKNTSVCAHKDDLAPPRMKGSSCSAVIIKLALPQPPPAHPSHSNNRVAGCQSPKWCLGHQMHPLPPPCMMAPKCVSPTQVFLSHSPRLRIKLLSCCWTCGLPTNTLQAISPKPSFPSSPLCLPAQMESFAQIPCLTSPLSWQSLTTLILRVTIIIFWQTLCFRTALDLQKNWEDGQRIPICPTVSFLVSILYCVVHLSHFLKRLFLSVFF